MSHMNFNVDFGDLSLTKSSDLSKLQTTDEDITQAVHTILKTNHGDYRLRPYYGIDFQKWIGRPINITLADTIKREIDARLAEITGIKSKQPEVLYILGKNTITFRITLKGTDSINFSFVKDKGVKVLR